MDSKKYDMYKQVENGGQGSWSRVAPPVVSTKPKPEGKERKTEVKTKKKELEVKLEITGVTPELPVKETPCGYCITPAMSYTPMTQWSEPYESEVALNRGTIFPELDLPFIGNGACDL